jgi:hypothetical protein
MWEFWLRFLILDSSKISYLVPFFPLATADIRNIFLSPSRQTLTQFPACCDYSETIIKIPQYWAVGIWAMNLVLNSVCFSVNGKCGDPVLWSQSAQLCGDPLLLHFAATSIAALQSGFPSYYNAQASTDQSANDITSHPSWALC